ncbi:PQQ-dependent sugar dehydrogenase [Frigidibacter sp. MR17.14]|uniref:PQQ-dependent sugar dehydrogenase n=1 Tax=Frigidibacter sp. MR17.14 TaxID=3126509 RepID=UPI0030130A73
MTTGQPGAARPVIAVRAGMAGLVLALLPTLALASEVRTSAGVMRIAPVVEELDEPWALAFLPGGEILVTERDGRLTRHPATGGAGAEVSGLPEVRTGGQGGLFDVLVPADFAAAGEILISYAAETGDGIGTTVAVARLDGTVLRDLRVLWQMRDGGSTTRHYGGRLAEGPDGAIYLTTGERGLGAPAQDAGSGIGAVIRIPREGGGGTVVSHGHRNPQGLAFDAGGQLWLSEHGARGGDEVNLIREGANYGWPEVSHGTNYDGTPFPGGATRADVEPPAHYWDPSIAPSGHMVLRGAGIPDWAGDHFVGSLKFDYIARLDPATWEEERIEAPETGRVRDIREGPDGAIWFLSVNDGVLYRMAPER